MKKTICFAAMSACIAFSACEEKDVEAVSVGNDGQKFTLNVNVQNPDVKSTVNSDGNSIGNLELLVFDANGELEDYSFQNGTVWSGELSCTKGRKKVVALVNTPFRFNKVARFSDLSSMRADLLDNTMTTCVLEGMLEVDVTNSQTLEVAVKRQVSKIIVEEIKLAFALDHMKYKTVNANAIYLINVPGDRAFFSDAAPTKWYNQLKATETTAEILYDDLRQIALTEDSPILLDHSFYTYPNPYTTDSQEATWSERPTRLVLELKINSVKSYYPVTLPTLMPNHRYRVSLTITRPGSSSPDHPVDKYVIAPTIKVEPWTEGESRNEVI